MTAGNMDKGPRLGVGRTAEVYAWGDHQILKLYRADMPRDGQRFVTPTP